MEQATMPEIDMPYDCDVYEPAEDTFLFLDALQDELPFLTVLEPSICLEIGCGSGAVFVYLANALRKLQTHAMFLATDINPLAASVAQQTATINQVQSFDIVRTNLVACYEQRLQNKIDVLLFNPPYVPTPSEEVGSTYDFTLLLQLRTCLFLVLERNQFVLTMFLAGCTRGIEAAWAGGVDGREVIDRLLPKLKDLLSPTGVFYMVVVVENKPKDIAAILAKDGFTMTVVRSTKARNERLSILKFSRTAL